MKTRHATIFSARNSAFVQHRFPDDNAETNGPPAPDERGARRTHQSTPDGDGCGRKTCYGSRVDENELEKARNALQKATEAQVAENASVIESRGVAAIQAGVAAANEDASTAAAAQAKKTAGILSIRSIRKQHEALARCGAQRMINVSPHTWTTEEMSARYWRSTTKGQLYVDGCPGSKEVTLGDTISVAFYPKRRGLGHPRTRSLAVNPSKTSHCTLACGIRAGLSRCRGATLMPPSSTTSMR